MKEWFAVYTQPRKEGVAAEHLERQNFQVFYPRYLKRRSHARKVSMVAAPLFPRYIFVSFDPGTNGWRPIRSTRGVIDLVCNGNDPVPVPANIIEDIRARSGDDGYIALARQSRIARGTRIRIDSGPLSSCEAIFETEDDHGRVVALLSLLGRKVVIKLPVQSVVPADLA